MLNNLYQKTSEKMTKNFLQNLCQFYHLSLGDLLNDSYAVACIVSGDSESLESHLELQAVENWA